MEDVIKNKLDLLANEYLEAFLAFAHKRTSTVNEAEELSQEIALECVKAIHRNKCSENFNAYLWSIAHNTYKRWLHKNRKITLDENIEYIGQISDSSENMLVTLMQTEEMGLLRKKLSFLSSLYRRCLVYFYFEEMSIAEIATKLCISVEMVKFYLSKGRKQLKEAFIMDDTTGEKSYNPSDFSIYYSGIDFSGVNIWKVYQRKLPCQIALICYDKVQNISEISLQTGTPAVYIEDEISLLVESGTIIEQSKGKYRTHFFILKKESLKQVKLQFENLMKTYAPKVIELFTQYLPQLRSSGIFKYEAEDSRYAWHLMTGIIDFDPSLLKLSDADYPVILSCGARAFIFAAEEAKPVWGAGRTPTFLEKCTVYPTDVCIFGKYHHQDELRSVPKAQALYDAYLGETKDTDKELYAELIEQGYILKRGEKLICDVAVTTKKAQKIFDEINAELSTFIQPHCKEIFENLTRIVKATLPPRLKEYAKGYTATEIMFYSTMELLKALYDKGFLIIPEKTAKMPVACYILEK